MTSKTGTFEPPTYNSENSSLRKIPKGISGMPEVYIMHEEMRRKVWLEAWLLAYKECESDNILDICENMADACLGAFDRKFP